MPGQTLGPLPGKSNRFTSAPYPSGVYQGSISWLPSEIIQGMKADVAAVWVKYESRPPRRRGETRDLPLREVAGTRVEALVADHVVVGGSGSEIVPPRRARSTAPALPWRPLRPGARYRESP